MSDSTMSAAAGQGRLMPWWLVLIQGIVAVVVGLFLIFQTVPTTILLVTFFGWWWLISGIFEIGSLFVDRTAWGWRLFTGVLSVLAGIYIIGAPLVGTVVVVGVATLLIGINGMIIGVVDIIKAAQGAGWGKGVLGVLSLIIGAVIAFNFTSFMSALPWVWGVFAVLGGVSAVAISWQLHQVETGAGAMRTGGQMHTGGSAHA
jgi:uncharacterized membrane protein HdeD (DUF308 family)